MTSTELVSELIKYDHEEEWLEFKENWFQPDELGHYISALANCAALEGRKFAYFIWGVTNYLDEETGLRKIVGTSFDFNGDVKGQPLQHRLSAGLFPDVNFKFEEVFIGDKRLVLLTIPAAKNVPVAYNHKRYIRIGSSREDVFNYPEREAELFFVLRHGLASMVNTASEYQDLTFEKLLFYYSSKGIELNRNTFKQNLSLYTESGEYNILAQVLSDNSHIPIRVAMFAGTDKSDKMYSVAEIGMTCLLYSLDDALRYGKILNIPQADERNRIVERLDVPLFDEAAFHEAMINAFVHNKWVSCNPPMISVFSDRIEILSHGSLPPELSMEQFEEGVSIPVNPKLAEIFLQLHISEKSGRGVRIIIKKCGLSAYRFFDNAISVSIPFNRINTQENKPETKDPVKVTTPVDEAVDPKEKKLNETQVRMLAEIRNNPNVTRNDLANILGLKPTTAYYNIDILARAGYIERVGSRKGGYWKVLK
ncbi:MAG: putative DNA binding domain-containing protein [Clostridia bacterium]|nr:putative DNA binding domain-containing protein [Clostridia bacterium]